MRTEFVRATLLAGAASPLLLIAGAAQAQTAAQPTAAAADTDAEELVVTGYRRSLQVALSNKLNSDRIVESVSAEDIGRLPDNSIADAIARLPGLTTQRLNGRSQVISIRGFAPDFSSTLLNGREQVTNGDNRSVEFDQYPAEVINQVLVYKTPDASLIAQGLSGTVDLQTIRPLSYGKQVISVGARYEYTDNGRLNAGSKQFGWRGSALYVDQFADGKVGVLLGISHIDSPTQTERFNAWGYPNANASNVVIGGSKSYVDSVRLQRTGVTGALEFKPAEDLTIAFDGYYSKFKEDQILRGIELPLFWSAAQLAPGFQTANGLVTNGTFNGVKGVVRNDLNKKEADLYSGGINLKWENDEWQVIGDASYSGIDRSELVLETYAGTGRNALGATDNLGFTMTDRGATFRPSLNYGDYNLIRLTSPQGWGGDVANPGGQPIRNGQDGYYNDRQISDELYAFRAQVERKLDGALSAIQAGVNYTNREKSLTPDEFFLGLRGNTDGLTSVAIPTELRQGTTNLGFLGLGPMVSYDPLAMLNSGVYNRVRNPNADVNTKGWTVREKVITGWLMGKLNADLGNAKLTGNIGLQVVNVDQDSTALISANVNNTIVSTVRTLGAKYTDVLPSANLSLRMPDDLVVRLGLARQLARPRLDDMRAAVNYNFNTNVGGNVTPWSGGGGNPALRPWRANAIDLSIEKYIGGKGYVALAGFYKDLENYIQEIATPFDFTGFPLPAGVPQPSTRQGFINQWVNAKGGQLYGAELSGVLPFNLLTPALDGFGINGSVAWTKSRVAATPGGDPDDLPGYSRWVTNLTGYYEKGGFSARASMRTRSSFLGELRGFGGGNQRRRADGELILDTQLSYEIQGGPLKGLTILAQAQNLTNEPFVTFNPGRPQEIIDYQDYGRRFLIGFNWRY